MVHPAKGDESVARQLWRENDDLARAALGHPFVRGIADGTLDPQRYADYLAQDALFLESFARAYALALARSPDREGVEAFAELITGVREELRLHAGVADRWGLDMSTVEPAGATLAYTEFLLAVAATGGSGPTCAAMTPCMRLYAHLGQSLATGPVADRYAEWVQTYADPGFDALVQRLEQLLDRYTVDIDGIRATYRRAMRLELAFFDAALNP